MNKSPSYKQQTQPKQCKSRVEEIYIYQNLESGRHTVSKSENELRVPCSKESQAEKSESSHIQGCFVHQKAHLCMQPCRLHNRLNRPSRA